MPLEWDVLFFGSVDWDANWQRPQAVATALAEMGARVLYVDNVGLRLPRGRDARRIRHRVAARAGRVSARQQPSEGVARFSPLLPPAQQFRLVRALARREVLRRARAFHSGERPLVVWTYAPNPVVQDAAKALGARGVVYDWCDDAAERLLVGGEKLRRRVDRWQEGMAARADVLFVPSEELLRRGAGLNDQVHLLRHGSSVGRGRNRPAPASVTQLPRPRIGFVGSISDWVNLELLEGVAAARPGWSLVLAGPARTRVDKLARRANVHLLGARPYEEISALLWECDAGVVPYRLNATTTAASPCKLTEYVDHGLPVVSVDLPEARHFGPEVEVATGVDGFVAALERAVARGRHEPRREGTWSSRVAEMVSIVSKTLGLSGP